MSRGRKRVFITAAGVVSCAGNNAAEFYKSLSSLKSGIGLLTRADTDRLKTKIGGQCDIDLLIKELGFDSVCCEHLCEKLNLSRNPKLLFAIHAIGQIAAGGAFAKIGAARIKLFTGAGLEEIGVSPLRRMASAAGVEKERQTADIHICAEPPSAFLGEVISGYFKFGKPPAVLVSACSAAAMAIGEAYKNISAGALEAAVAGGTDSTLSAFSINAFNSIGALTEENGDPARAMKPFDKKRGGTVLGEGAAYFLMESENCIAASGGVPVAEIIGYGSSLDAYNPVQPDPEGRGASLAMKRALEDASSGPGDIDYINAHGTATLHNDIAETKAVKDVFKGGGVPPAVSSTKPFFGHLLSAAGAIELLSVLYAMQTSVIPPTLNLEEAGEGCDLNYIPGAGLKKKVRAALKNSFGLNGQNASLILKSCD
jgi:3-oxoacyl-(acyl-carrier-protein) synthase